MTGGKTDKRILPAWPASSHSESLMLRCDILWKPWTCADSSLFLPLVVPVVLLLERTQSVKTFLDIKAVSVHSGRRGAADWDLSSSSWWQSEKRALSGGCPLPSLCLASGADPEIPPVSARPDSSCLSAEASDHVFLDKLVSKSSDTEDEPTDFREQCRHAVTAWVWLCLQQEVTISKVYFNLVFSSFLLCSL